MNKKLIGIIAGAALGLSGLTGCGSRLEYDGTVNNLRLMEQTGFAPPEQRETEYYGLIDNVRVRSLLYDNTRQLFIIGPGGGRIEFLGNRNKPEVELVEIVNSNGKISESYGIDGKNGFNIPDSYVKMYSDYVNSIQEANRLEKRK